MSNEVGDFFQIFVAFSEIHNFIYIMGHKVWRENSQKLASSLNHLYM